MWQEHHQNVRLQQQVPSGKCQQQQHHDSDERKPRVKGTISCKHKEQYDSDSDDQGHAKKKPKIHTTSPTEKDHKNHSGRTPR